ncbi:hypothetical protein AB0K43_09005 [Kitasatospora sp. NPDC049258]|uniref:aromatic-ring hydroxylase C-terminal domain-containing protein n=1 Tax=Kitasatospora sp. NPDC049258 TaxID=3155394 RepID=UPI0034266ACE
MIASAAPSSSGVVLVRPDGHIAWRTPSPPTTPTLRDTLRRILTPPAPVEQTGTEGE